MQGQVSVIKAQTLQLIATTNNEIEVAKASAQADGDERDLTDKGTELKLYIDKMYEVYEKLRVSLGTTWTNLIPLIAALELKNNEYLSKNFMMIPKELRVMMEYQDLKALGSHYTPPVAAA